MSDTTCHCDASEYEHIHKSQVTEERWKEIWAEWADYNDE